MSTPEGLYVRSHASRDLLQSAALFKNEHLAIWEYVSNGLQYVDPGSSPCVRVRLDSKNRRISVHDNGRGMLFADLENFFVMHGENVDRKAGRVGRGRFGTGKSAAFGIADTLVLTTVRNGKRTKVTLSRTDIESMSDGSPVPVKTLEREVAVSEPNGTVVEIRDIQLRTMDQKNVIRFIERHLAHWSRDAAVWVNNHLCEPSQPTAVHTETIDTPVELQDRLGECRLILRVSATPLSEDERGVAIFSKGVWHETTLAGCEGRDMANFIFGEIDVAKLDDDSSRVAAFDMSRSMQLNRANETVQALMALIAQNVERLRKNLVAQERTRKASEDAKRLEKQADEIAKVINEDFAEFRRRVAKARARAQGGEDHQQHDPNAGEDGDELTFGFDEPAEVVNPLGQPGAEGDGGGNDGRPREMKPEIERRDKGNKLGRDTGGSAGRNPRPRGGFSIDFRSMGESEKRAKYHREERQIVINLDHPQFKAALGAGGIEDTSFRRLAYEVAFFEYALALALELALRDEYMDITDPIVEIGDTINRVARRSASLYANS